MSIKPNMTFQELLKEARKEFVRKALKGARK